MKHYQREFQIEPVTSNRTWRYPIPYSIFSRNSNQTGSITIFATFGGASYGDNEKMLIENYFSWLNLYTWRVKVEDNGNWSKCEVKKGRNRLGHGKLKLIMVECQVDNITKSQFLPQRVSFNISSMYREIISFEELLVCNENPIYEQVDLVGCTMVSDDHLARLPEWVEYHRLIGFQRFIIHIDSPNFDSYKQFLSGYMARYPKLIYLVPYYFESQRRPEDSARQDCLFRSKGFSKYIAMFDVDEFYHLKDGNDNLVTFLDEKINGSQHFDGIRSRTWLYGDSLANPVGDFSLAIESFQMKQDVPYINERDKTIYVTDKTYYVFAHFGASGEALLETDPYNEVTVNHYRFPQFTSWQESRNQNSLVLDSSLSVKYAELVKSELRHSGFYVADTIPSIGHMDSYAD